MGCVMAPASSMPSRPARVGLAVGALVAWFVSQAVIGVRPAPAHGIGDLVLDAFSGANHFLTAMPWAANLLLATSSAVIDLLGAFLFLSGTLGRSVRPLLGLVLLFSLRQLCQLLVALPAPPEMIWHHPGVPSLLVTYGVANDLFFSGHTAVAVYGAVEIARLRLPNARLLAAGVAAFEILTVLMLHAHYTMDVFTGMVTALYVAGITPTLAARVDRWLGARHEVRAP